MTLVIFFIAAAVPPILAVKGLLFRGVWFAGLIVFGLLALLFGSLGPSNFDPDVVARASAMAYRLASFFAGLSFGCLLAACLHRSKKISGPTS
jgi:hypothetical protein